MIKQQAGVFETFHNLVHNAQNCETLKAALKL